MSYRIYVVTGPEGESMVEAKSQASALHSVVFPKYTAKIATPSDVVRLMSAGKKVVKVEAA